MGVWVAPVISGLLRAPFGTWQLHPTHTFGQLKPTDAFFSFPDQLSATINIFSLSKALQNVKRFSMCDVWNCLPLSKIQVLTFIQIGDALVKLKYPYGGFLNGLQMFSPGVSTRVYWPAITFKMVETKALGELRQSTLPMQTKKATYCKSNNPRGCIRPVGAGL